MKTDYTRYRLSLMENIVFGMGYLVAAAVVCIIFYDSFLPLIHSDAARGCIWAKVV